MPSALETATRWATRDGCDPEPLRGPNIDVDGNILGDETTVDTWGGCTGGHEVALWSIVGGIHTPLMINGGTAKALDFLMGVTKSQGAGGAPGSAP